MVSERWSLLLFSPLLINTCLEGEADRGVLLLKLVTIRFQTVVQVVSTSQLPRDFIADTVLAERHLLVRTAAIIVV